RGFLFKILRHDIRKQKRRAIRGDCRVYGQFVRLGGLMRIGLSRQLLPGAERNTLALAGGAVLKSEYPRLPAFILYDTSLLMPYSQHRASFLLLFGGPRV